MFASYGIWEDLAHDLATILRIFETDPKSTSDHLVLCLDLDPHSRTNIFYRPKLRPGKGPGAESVGYIRRRRRIRRRRSRNAHVTLNSNNPTLRVKRLSRVKWSVGPIRLSVRSFRPYPLSVRCVCLSASPPESRPYRSPSDPTLCLSAAFVCLPVRPRAGPIDRVSLKSVNS